LLSGARKLIAFSWTQDADARDADGFPIDPSSPDAVCWSLLGALVAGYERLLWSDGERAALEELARTCLLLGDVLDSDSLTDWNNVPGRTQADVLAALDRAQERPLPPRKRYPLN
jgi:hypothetical protein